MSDELAAHLRYPEDLFSAQNESYRLYHLPATEAGATTFYNEDDRWAIPDDVAKGTGEPMEPYYVTMRIPGEDAAEFALIQPMVPEGRSNMIAWVAARMDPGHYGERIAFRFPTDTTTQGPEQIEARIDQNDTIGDQFGVWSRSGSSDHPRQPAGAADRRRRPALRRADLPPGRGRPLPRVRARDHGRPAAASPSPRRSRRACARSSARPSRRRSERQPRSPSRRRRRASPLPSSPVSCRPTSPAWWPRRTASTTRRRPRWSAAISGRTRSGSTSSPTSFAPWPSSPGSRGLRLAMDVLVIGSGGREHALAWRLARDDGVRRVRIAPGNGGTAAVAEPVPDLDVTRPDGGRAARGSRALRPRGHRSGGAAGGRRGRRAGIGAHSRPSVRPGPPRASSRARRSRSAQMERAGVATASAHSFTDPGRGAGARPCRRAPAGGQGRLAGGRQGRRRARDGRGGGGRSARSLRRRGAGRARSCSRSASPAPR